MWQDIVFALRWYRRAPVFVLTVVLTIAAGLGLNGMLFTLFNAYVLRTSPVRDPHSLYEVGWTDQDGRSYPVSWPAYQDLEKTSAIVAEAHAYRWVFSRLDGLPAFGQMVTGNYFTMLDVGPALGRTLLPSDAVAPGRSPVAVLSYRTWQNRFAGDSTVLGRKILIRGYPFEVVGVARAGFGGLLDMPPDFWAPVTMLPLVEEGSDPFGADRTGFVRPVVRLRPGADPTQAGDALRQWGKTASSEVREAEKVRVVVHSRATLIVLSPDLVVLFAPIILAFLLVMLIACTNVANMMLARGLSRQREIGIRLGVGADRARLIRQLLTESLLLAFPAAALGLVISQVSINFGTRLMMATLPPEFAPYIRVPDLPVDLSVTGFMMLGASGCALLFGLLPALHTTRLSVVQASRGDFDHGIRPSRLRSGLVVAQITGCALLLICAGVFLLGARRMQQMDPGIRTENVLAIDYGEKFRAALVARWRARPEVLALAAASTRPLEGKAPRVPVVGPNPRDAVSASYVLVSGGYFGLLSIPIVSGRTFSQEEERSRAQVAIVNEALARRLWPGRDPLGQTLELAPIRALTPGSSLDPYRTAQVIGVAHDAAYGWIGERREQPVVFYPADLETSPVDGFLALTAGNARDVGARLDRELSVELPGAIDNIHTLDAAFALGVYPFTVAHWMLTGVGTLALALTVVGVYGVLAYLVAQRTKEIGIRMALGAKVPAVVGLVLRQSLRLSAWGIGVGLLAAAALSRLLASNPFLTVGMMNTLEPLAYLGGAVTVFVACLAAACVPSLRAARVNPLDALRSE